MFDKSGMVFVHTHIFARVFLSHHKKQFHTRSEHKHNKFEVLIKKLFRIGGARFSWNAQSNGHVVFLDEPCLLIQVRIQLAQKEFSQVVQARGFQRTFWQMQQSNSGPISEYRLLLQILLDSR